LLLNVAKELRHKFNEHPHAWYAPHAGGIDQVDRRCVEQLPVGQRRDQNAAGNLVALPLRPSQESSDAAAGNRDVPHDVAMCVVRDEPASDCDRDLLITAAETPEVQHGAGTGGPWRPTPGSS